MTDEAHMMKGRIFGLALALLLSVPLSAQSIQWLSWEEAIELSESQKKKFFVDIYTEWCTWCKKMDESTFTNPNIIAYMNENYYAIKFDAEQREDITIGDNTYKFVKSGKRGFHELAFEITRGRLSYPTVVFLDENMRVIQSLGGYWNAERFKVMMSFFAENHYKSTPWNIYSQQIKESNRTKAVPVGNRGN